MKIEIDLEAKIFDPDGNLVWKNTWECKSYVVAMIQLLYCQMGQTPALSMKDIAGSITNIATDTTNLSAVAASALVTRGIIVGTGTAAVTITDYVLATPIAAGTATGELLYGAVSFTAPSASAGVASFNISRSFTNATTVSITIREVAIYAAGSAGAKNFCIERNLPSGSILVGAGSTSNLTYNVKVSV